MTRLTSLVCATPIAQVLLARSTVAELRARCRPSSRDGAALREREDTFRRLASTANEGITIIVDDTVVEANSAFAKLFGYDSAEIGGRAPLDFIAPESREVASRFMTLASAKPHEVYGRRKDGSTFDMELITKSVPYKGRTALGCVVRDISERKEVDRLKSEFVSIVSHELRTPLTSIRGSLGLMEGGAVGELPAKARDLVRIARQNAERLIRLINDILDLEKLEAGKVQLQIAALDPAELVESTLAELRTMAHQYRVTLRALVHHCHQVAGDRDRVVQVLTNLVSNAVKFSPEGGTVTVALADGAPGFLRFAVKDHGRGIPAEQLGRLFMRFEQLEQADTRRRGGTGLGLAISRSLVEQQGGKIGVISAPGHGSEFWFELPLVAAQGASETTSEGSSPAGAHTILVVEDDTAVARVLGIMLRRDGLEVTVAGSIAEARDTLARVRPAAILLDMKLPDGSGLDLLDQLHGATQLQHLPVVVLSGLEPIADERHRHARVVEWLTKPFAESELLRALRSAIAQ